MLNTTYGMIHTFGDSVVIKSFTDAFQIPRFNRSSTFVLPHLETATTDQLRWPGKCLTMGSTSPPIFKTPINLTPSMNNVREQGWPLAEGVAATKTNDAKVIVDFLKSNIFYRFGVPKALISDQGSHFYNRAMSSLLEKYGVVHRVAQHTTHKKTAKLKYSIRKSRKFFKRLQIPTEKIGADSLRMLYGHTRQHTRLH
ncbi:hypothetical protein CR513_42884, partial [Mucuna pruriens]